MRTIEILRAAHEGAQPDAAIDHVLELGYSRERALLAASPELRWRRSIIRLCIDTAIEPQIVIRILRARVRVGSHVGWQSILQDTHLRIAWDLDCVHVQVGPHSAMFEELALNHAHAVHEGDDVRSVAVMIRAVHMIESGSTRRWADRGLRGLRMITPLYQTLRIPMRWALRC